MNFELRYYIASPGFNKKQLDRIAKVEEQLNGAKANYFSPFSHSGKLQLGKDPELNKLAVKLLYDENIKEITNCNRMIAIVDDFDKGTAFEVGFFIGNIVDDLAEISERLLIIGSKSEEFSTILSGVINYYLSNSHNFDESIPVVDITEKTMDKYILMGILSANSIPIVSFSSTELESNLMTSCATMIHYQQKGKMDDIHSVKKSIEAYEDLLAHFNNELFNLSHLKLAKKVE